MDESSTTTLGDRVRRAQRGDEAALRELIVSYQHRIAGFAYAITGRSDSVEDLAQMVFVKMARAIARPASAGPASAGPASAGPASAGPASAGPASAGPASAGPASAGPASAGPASA